MVLKVPKEAEESLDILVLLEQWVGQEVMVHLA